MCYFSNGHKIEVSCFLPKVTIIYMKYLKSPQSSGGHEGSKSKIVSQIMVHLAERQPQPETSEMQNPAPTLAQSY